MLYTQNYSALENSLEIKEIVKGLENRTLNDLLTPPFETAKAAFKIIDVHNTGFISNDDWLGFIEEARRHRLRYYKIRLLLNRACFAGKGICNPYVQEKTVIHRGWARDFQYYLMNNCKWPSVFFADVDHPFP